MKTGESTSVRIKLASPKKILGWSHGEVTKPETINYRTQKSEKDGLFCERIFGPTKDYQCYCGKHKGIRYKGVVCDRCGVEVTTSSVRRERMGHITLACPVGHIWFLRGVPSAIGRFLNLSRKDVERVVYFAGYIITNILKKEKEKVLRKIEKEYKTKTKVQKSKIKDKKELEGELEKLKEVRDLIKKELLEIRPLRVISEIEYQRLALKYGQVFTAGSGAETIRKILEKIDLEKEIKNLTKELKTAPETKKKRIRARLSLFKNMERQEIRPEWTCLTVLPVLPPDLRPLVKLDGGRFASSDLNDLYRRVINRNNRLKYLLEIRAPEVIIRNEKRILQEAVDALFDNEMRTGTTVRATTGQRRLLKSLAAMLKGKKGRFRGNLLGKRVDYSGRSVIVVGPELKLNQVGLPKEMALELFKPFVIRRILEKELAYHVRGASRLIERQTDEIWALLEEEVKGKLVLLNRAPTLHRLGIQAFYPVLIEGEAIRVHPMICEAFNADFDGDQMAVYLPLSRDAQKEARDSMLSLKNLLKPATGKPMVSLSQDIVLGIYWMTQIIPGARGEGRYFSDFKESILAQEFEIIDLRAKIKVPQKNTDKKQPKSAFFETSVGRIIFNQALPEDFPFVNKKLGMKKLKRVVAELVENYTPEIVWPILDEIKNLGFEYSTKSGITWGMDDLRIPEEKGKIIAIGEKEVEKTNLHYKKGLLSAEERRAKVIEVWHQAKAKIEKLVPKILSPSGSIFTIIDSGARGSWSQPVQMAGMKGLVVSPAGRVMEFPVKSCFKEGLNSLEYFISTHGARKGLVDTALRTASAGYLTRRLVDVAHGVIILEEDCKDKEGITIFRKDADKIDQDFALKIAGRITLEEIRSQASAKTSKKGKIIVKKGDIIDWKTAAKIIKEGIKKVQVRSPLSCKLKRGICQKCYGWSLASNKTVEMGEAVGIIAAQSIGEPGTQLTLKTFHVGGVAGEADITSGLPRVEEVFEIRSPKGKAVIAKTKGVVKLVDEKEGNIEIKVLEKKSKNEKKAKQKEVIIYKIPAKRGILIKEGQKVEPGDKLCEGNVDLRELFKVAGVEATKRHIVNEIQKIYASQGAVIHDKHIEVMVKQMFSRMKIKESGDSLFSPGEIIEEAKFLEENEKLKKKKKKQAEGAPVLLGITKVALTTESFLSAASFEQTSRVLIEAALEGKEDKLRGLKENVIIGNLIPVGTGFRKHG